MHRYYADADLYVQTPAIDNMPLSLLEAFASGLPVVATRIGGVPAMLRDGVHGLLVRDDDDEAVAAQVIRLLEQPALRPRARRRRSRDLRRVRMAPRQRPLACGLSIGETTLLRRTRPRPTLHRAGRDAAG